MVKFHGQISKPFDGHPDKQDIRLESTSTLCVLGNFSCSFVICRFFQNQFCQKTFSGIPPECQTVWIQIRPDIVGPDLDPKCLQKLSADSTDRQNLNILYTDGMDSPIHIYTIKMGWTNIYQMGQTVTVYMHV